LFYPENRIYWADADLSIIESVNLTGKERKIVIAEVGALPNPFCINDLSPGL
jgi:hypothetical protein